MREFQRPMRLLASLRTFREFDARMGAHKLPDSRRVAVRARDNHTQSATFTEGTP